MAVAAEKTVLVPENVIRRRGVKSVLKELGLTPRVYRDMAEIGKSLAAAPAEAVVLDSPPDAERFETVKMVHTTCPDAVVRGMGEEDQEGADAVLREKFTPPEFPTAMRLAAANKQLREALEQLDRQNRIIAELEKKALHDSLTGLYNRYHFLERTRQELARARRGRARFAIAMFDVDRFKRVNDRHGHPVGDVVLKEIADILTRALRVMDTIARYGGEEFIVLLPGTRGPDRVPFDPIAIVERVRADVESNGFSCAGTRAGPLRATVSAGVALYPEDGADVDALIHVADAWLLRAKNAGRNRVLPNGGATRTE